MPNGVHSVDQNKTECFSLSQQVQQKESLVMCGCSHGSRVPAVDLSKTMGQPKYCGVKGGNSWWNRRRFSVIGGMCPGCPQSLHLWLFTCFRIVSRYRLGRAPSPRASDSEEEDVSARRGKNGKQTEARTKAGAPSKGAVPKLQANKKSEESNEGKRETKGKERNGERKTFHQMSYEGL